MKGGGSRDWLVPLKPDGRGLQHASGDISNVEVIGCHRGFYAGLNVANPRPGHQYEWCSADPRDVFLARQRGWQQVHQGDEDSPAFHLAYDQDSDAPTPLDTAHVFHDVVLMRTPERNHRRLMDGIAQLNRAAINSATEGFLQGASPEERATGRTAHGYVPTRYSRREHGTQVREGDAVVEQWGPSGKEV